MKYVFALSLSMIGTLLFGQDFMSANGRHDLELIQTITQDKSTINRVFEDLKRNFPIYEIGSKSYLAFIAELESNFDISQLEKFEILKGSQLNNIATFRIPLQRLTDVKNLEGIRYMEIAQKVTPNVDGAVKDVRADSVQQGINLPQAYTGKDVLIGVTDWGFDYSHPNFYDTSLLNTRIAGAWDQYKQAGPHPTGFDYGTEYTTEEELLTAQSDTSNIYSYALHGTHVAGIAGGAGGGTAHRGVAFEAQYLFTTFLIDAAAVLDAYAWMYQKSESTGKRLVINQSWGLHHIGNLDGTSLLSKVIDDYSFLGVVFVTSGGNNGARKFHLKKTFASDTLRSKINFYDYSFETMWGQSLSLWGEANESFSTSIQVFNVSNELLTETPFYNTSNTLSYIDSMLITGSDTVFFNVSSETANPLNSRPHMRFRVKNTNTNLKIVMVVTSNSATVNCWNVVELTNDVGNWGMAFIKNRADQTDGDNDYGIGEPACTKSTIAVAAYSTGADIASFSSFGPTLDNRVKPDISGPGVDIASSISSYTDRNYNLLTSVEFKGRTYPFSRLSGTSMSGPVVAGIVALMLEANPYLSSYQVKEIIQETARIDSYTGTIPPEGSLRWGAGKINAYAAIQKALQTIGNVELAENELNSIQVFPNPTSGMLTFASWFDLSDSKVTILDQAGRIVVSKVVGNQLDISAFESGVYLIHFEYMGRVYQKRIVKQ